MHVGVARVASFGAKKGVAKGRRGKKGAARMKGAKKNMEPGE